MNEIGLEEVALATKCAGELTVEPFVGDETVTDAKAYVLKTTSTHNIAQRTEGGVRRTILYLLVANSSRRQGSGEKFVPVPHTVHRELLRRLRSAACDWQ